jgi:MFS transporter, FHS family, L-fucose permease
MGVKEFIAARPLKARNDIRTNASELTLRQSIFPLILVTSLFFLWGFSYGTLIRSRPYLRRLDSNC